MEGLRESQEAGAGDRGLGPNGEKGKREKEKQGAPLRLLSFSPFRLFPPCPRREPPIPNPVLLRAVVLLALLTPCGFPRTASGGREHPPAVPPPKPFILPLPAVRTLPNGLKVVVVERHSLPLITLHLVVTAGAEADPVELPGTAQFVATLLNQGTQRRSAQQIAEAIDNAGGTIETGVDWDNSFVAVSVLTDHTELAFDLLSDIAIRPTFVSGEVERVRKRTLSALEVLRQDPSYLADAVFSHIVFTGTPYSHPADGTADTVSRMTADNLKEFHSRHYRPSNSILAVVGDITADQAYDYARRFFSSWEDRQEAVLPPVAAVEACPQGRDRRQGSALTERRYRPTTRVLVIDKPDAVQTEIRIGNLGVRRDSPDYYALTAANQILGGPASNRLFTALRRQHGLTYGASSDLTCYRSVGSWEAKTSTRTPETVRTVHMVLEQTKRLRDHPVSNEEVENAQNYLIGHRALDFETSDGIATQVLDLVIHNLPLDDWNRFPEKIRSLTSEDLWSATRRYLDPDHAVIVLVGNVEGFKKDLKKLGEVRIIPLDRVDLASLDLVGGRR